MNIQNKTILITGANRGIGRALVTEALRRGAKRVYAGTRSGELQTADNRVTPLTLDVTNLSQIQRAADEVDTLDVLINNAGDTRFLAAVATLERSHRQQSVVGGARPVAGHTRLIHFEGGRGFLLIA